MTEATLFPLEPSDSVYEALRNVRLIAEGVKIPEWVTFDGDGLREDDLLAEESYALVLLAIRCVVLLRKDVGDLEWVGSEAGSMAGSALRQLLEIESLLAGQVMSYKAEAIKLDAEQAEQDLHHARRARLTTMT
jgi:hypothetical protein